MEEKILYTAQANVRGGRDGRGRTSDGVLDVALSTPPELGGKGDGTNPEQLFAVGYGACFESAIRLVARRKRIDLGEVCVEASVSLLAAPERRFSLAAELAVSLPSLSVSDAIELVRAASETCPYSLATRGNIETTILANGVPI